MLEHSLPVLLAGMLKGEQQELYLAQQFGETFGEHRSLTKCKNKAFFFFFKYRARC
jgi:hypothetical protein